MASDGNYIDSYGYLLVNSSFIFTYLDLPYKKDAFVKNIIKIVSKLL